MYVEQLQLRDFRRYAEATFHFGPNANVILGANGAGKTTILEAIHLLALGHSFKTRKDQELIRWGADRALVKGNFGDLEQENATTVQVSFNTARARKILLDGTQLGGPVDLVGRIPVVALSPADSQLTGGPPEERRRFFNKLFAQVDLTYLKALGRYRRLLRQRNAFLAEGRDRGKVDENVALSLEKALAKVAALIQLSRKSYFSQFKGIVEEIFSDLDPEKSLEVGYKPSCKTDFEELEEGAAAFQDQWARLRNNELRLGTTLVGPHRDRFELLLNGQDLRTYASQGEHKLTQIALRLAEGRFLQAYKGREIIYLLDDLFATLDVRHSMQLLERLENPRQIFITSTDLADLRHHGLVPEQNSSFNIIKLNYDQTVENAAPVANS